jgi:hypothetical protein
MGVSITTALVPHVCYAAAGITAARSHFENGDLKRTKAALEKILLPKPRIAGTDLEDARKLYGVTLFLMGKRKNAEEVFRVVLSRNLKATLKESDILDPALSDVFEKVRASLSKNGPKTASTTLPMAPSNAALLVLNCSAPKAVVFVNGLFVGTCASPITLEAGKHEISVSAEGFEASRNQVALKLGQTKKLDIKLEKYKDSATDTTNEVFGSKQETADPSESENYSAPLPVPQNQNYEVIQLPQLQEGQEPQVFMQPAPYSDNSPRAGIPKRSYAVAFLPFGAGQFQNAQPIKGAVFLVAEAAGIGTFVYAYFKEKDFSNRESQFEPSDAAKYRKTLKLLANGSLAFTGLSYFVSVLDALVNIATPATAYLPTARPLFALSPKGDAQIGFSIRY